MTKINYIVPIKHPSRIAEPDLFVRLLGQTLSTIARQQNTRAIILSITEGTPLPALPQMARVITSASDEAIDTASADSLQGYYARVRSDKGLRVSRAFETIADRSDFMMVVDDDDLIHPELSEYVGQHDDGKCSGFVISKGYTLNIGTNRMAELDRFDIACGSSLIIRADRFQYRAGLTGADRDDAIAELGSHVLIPKTLRKKKDALRDIPFRAAIYRMGNPNATQGEISKQFSTHMTTDSRRWNEDAVLGDAERDAVFASFLGHSDAVAASGPGGG